MNAIRPAQRVESLEAIITADMEGRVVFWSRGAERIFRYSQAEMVGQPLTRLIPDFHRDAHEKGMQRVQHERASRLHGQTLHVEGLRKNGEIFPLELALATWFAADEVYFTGVITRPHRV